MSGRIELLMQYFRNGLVVVAKNRKCRLNKMNVVMFQLMMKMPVAAPTTAVLMLLTLPKYSGARNNAYAPNDCIKPPLIVLNKMYQKNNNTWNFLMCSITSCMG